MGAETCLHLAANHPDLTRGVFLEAPPIYLPGQNFGRGEQTIQMEYIGTMKFRYKRMFKLMPKFVGLHMVRRASPTYGGRKL